MTASLVRDLRQPHTPAAPSVGRQRARRSDTGMKVMVRLAKLAATATTLAAVAVFLFLAVGPRVLGYQTITMLTGSMSPLISPGDVVVTVPTPVNALKTGDIITYRIPVDDHRVETHRVVKIMRNADGTTTVQTKGDANNTEDPWTATLQGESIDVHTATIPYLGAAIRTLRDPVLLNTLMYGAPAVLVVMLLDTIWRKPPTRGTAAAKVPAGGE
ncbi:signal peptidase I [Arthrobacter sp. 92]|uniref:signal peptidase I n=1 Tax=Arthrobacter sp. 92 TaxID=3418175 RepID=UPI003CFBD32D